MKLPLRTVLFVIPGVLAGQQPMDTVELAPVVVTATRIPRPVAAPAATAEDEVTNG